MRQGLVLVPHEGRQGSEERFGTHHNIMMLSVVGVRDGSSAAELVRLSLSEPDAERLDRLLHESTHDRNNGR